ncbi:ABC transporter substrate-binding protein [Phytohabitans rumicis]|uniref:ABC transporter substrate-binding protein n=1 Tax=Phytohabitans rumicis TaxID=1076125 RepID=A0A6V8KZM9_9ACTN|nr:ABC transporter substrate-binding protein [Phytohabitans rumicis]GFJ87297.1 ABC transporter substrate-binding protein [Phytohabitans rumicis]
MVRKMVAAALAAVTAAGLTACGGGSSGDGADEVVIGASMMLSGQVNLETIRDGYQWAVDEANAAGGIDVGGTKRKVTLKILDNRGDTSTMVQQVRGLALEDKATALLGSCCQQNIDMSAQADSLQIPLVMGALPIELRPEGKGYVWDSFQSLDAGANGFFEVAASTDTNKKVLLITNNDAQGESTAELYTGLSAKAGFTIAAKSAAPAGTTDYADAIGKAKSAGAEVLIAVMTPPDCFAMWKQMKALGYAPKVAIGIQCAQTPGWTSLGELGAGTLVQMNWTRTSGLPKADEVVSKYAAKYPNDNDLSSVAIGYHEASILLAAITKAGSTDRKKVNEALARTDISSALGSVKYTDNKSATPSFIGQWNADGSITQVWPKQGGSALQALSGLS